MKNIDIFESQKRKEKLLFEVHVVLVQCQCVYVLYDVNAASANKK